MRIHHLNCGTMRPPLVSGGFVCHVLLVETPASGLVLVDTGFGTADVRDPSGRLGFGRVLLRPSLDAAETALSQVRALGHDPRDVRHVVLTHYDWDHTGGLSDFPWAQVHLTAAEEHAAWNPLDRNESNRYRRARDLPAPRIVTHQPGRGDVWQGVARARPLDEVDDGIVLVHLPGHTPGHAAVAVDAGDGWVLHVGDAFYHRGSIDGTGAPCPARLAERSMAWDRALVRANHERLTRLWTDAPAWLTLVNGHDPELFAQACRRRPPGSSRGPAALS